MNCQMAAWVATNDLDAAVRWLQAVERFIRTVEDHLSRFRPDSELAYLNAHPGRPLKVSQILWDVLASAIWAAEHTGGLYDPTILNALEEAGYTESFERLAWRAAGPVRPRPQRPAPQARTRFPWRGIRLDPAKRSVELPHGLRLDLGGIAKGWAAERAASHLSRLGPCLVDLGGDMAARGAPPLAPAYRQNGLRGWPIGVVNPKRPDEDLALLMVQNCGVATSGTDYRRWVHRGALQHHAIDPRTGRPARSDLLSVTVVAPDAFLADLYALMALILGSRQGAAHLAGRPGVAGLLVREDGSQLQTPGFDQYVLATGAASDPADAAVTSG